uniref:Regulator of G protein signaling like 1 n=3 Tax=Carduelinae TaxID=37599 RepID=A0A8C9MFA6_SERCA
ISSSIASTDMGLLLQDDVFVDFFNIFLSLPVSPLCTIKPEAFRSSPQVNFDASPAALLAWLEKHRLPHFCKSSLCLHLVLCQKLLAFIRSGEAAELLNWQSADQWLLERCISGSQGMQHFCAFLRGTPGEELIDFWLISERLLGLDESDGSQRELFLSLERRLRATHLREGSSILTFLDLSWLLPGGWDSVTTRREILSKMQEQVLFMIQSYWLPKFFVHCKMGMEEEELCRPLLQEYRERLSQAAWQQPPGLSEPLPTMHIKRSQGVSGPYCSQKAKAEVWALVKEGRDSQELKMATFQVKAEKQPGPAGSREELCLDKDAVGSIPQHSQHPAFGGRGGAAFPGRPQSSAVQDLENLSKEKIPSGPLPSASLARLPSLKKPIKTLDFLPWALSAEACAGRPFRDFLQHQNRPMETHLLDLWHDLEEFLPVVLDSNRENSFFLRHLIGEKICKTYLEDSSIEKLPLETRTLVSLWNRLICGEFSPWIFRAQKEICKVHRGAGSGWEVQLASAPLWRCEGSGDVPGRAAGRWGHFHLSQRMNQSLQLGQALHGTRSLEEISSKHWQLLAARDLQKGGSIQAEMELLLGSAGKRGLSLPAAKHGRSKSDNYCFPFSLRLLSFPGEEIPGKGIFPENMTVTLADATCVVSPQGWAWDAIRELVRSFCKFRRDMKKHTRRAEFEEFLRQERRNKRESMSSVLPPLLLPPLGQQQKVTLIKRRILDKQIITVNFLVDDLRFYLEMDRFSRLADGVEAAAPQNMESEKHGSFLKKKLEVISKLFLDSDIPPKLRVRPQDLPRKAGGCSLLKAVAAQLRTVVGKEEQEEVWICWGGFGVCSGAWGFHMGWEATPQQVLIN